MRGCSSTFPGFSRSASTTAASASATDSNFSPSPRCCIVFITQCDGPLCMQSGWGEHKTCVSCEPHHIGAPCSPLAFTPQAALQRDGGSTSRYRQPTWRPRIGLRRCLSSSNCRL